MIRWKEVGSVGVGVGVVRYRSRLTSVQRSRASPHLCLERLRLWLWLWLRPFVFFDAQRTAEGGGRRALLGEKQQGDGDGDGDGDDRHQFTKHRADDDGVAVGRRVRSA